MSEFCHLHCHSEYSLLDGMSRLGDMVKRAKELKQPAIALTDHGVMFGAIEFYRAAKKQGIKPIMGVEAYLAPRGMRDRDSQLDRKPFHMLLLAQNQTGYQNLLKLCSVAQLEGFYGKPRIDKQMLGEHSQGLIATTGCLAAEIPRLLMNEGEQAAEEKLKWYLDVFGRERFFLELQGHNIPELRLVNNTLLSWARKHEIGLVATNDVHYVRQEDAGPHDILLCMQTRDFLSNPKRMRLTPHGSYYITSTQEMQKMFDGFPGALKNTIRIAEMCEVNLDSREYHLPIFPVPEGYDAESYLRHLVETGVVKRYGAERAKHDPVLRERVERELGIIHNMGFDTYFLIVWDLCLFAARVDIWWNVRGSGAGSVVAYALRITNIDPLKYDLIFERFLNPARVSMPDFDLDFPDDRRHEMIEYSVRKYGNDKCAAIITFGTLGGRAAVRDVGRTMEVPLSEVNRVARMVPSGGGKGASLKKLLFDDGAVEDWPIETKDLREVYEQDEKMKMLLDTAIQLEGQTRHASTHAAGVVISDKPIWEYAPLHRPTKGDDSGPIQQVIQFDMNIAESIGLLKVDFLGLATLSIMRRACELIEQRHGRKLHLDTIPYERRHDDPEADADVMAAYKLIQAGHTVGVFQVEGAGMRRMLQEMLPEEFENIIAAISLYRPGPMEYIETYIKRLHKEEEVAYHHKSLAPILENTHGIIVYQEQIMRIASDLAGYNPGEADLMRRAVSKKKAKEIERHKKIFIDGAIKNGVDRASAETIYGDIEYFARYGFNKCLPGDVEVIDAATGRLVKIADLYQADQSTDQSAAAARKLEQTVTCDIEQLKLQAGHVSKVMDNGVKPVFRVTTALGRTIEATANHPFYTLDGWRLLVELKKNDLIAVPRYLPVEGQNEWPEHEVIALAHLLAAPRGRPQLKEIPAAAFELSNRQIALLLSRMWAADGHINIEGRSLDYATPSPRIAHQVQHLLLRFGIISQLRPVELPDKDGRMSYQLMITGHSNIAAFTEHIGGLLLNEHDKAGLERVRWRDPASFATKDMVPLGVKPLLRGAKAHSGITRTQMRAESGVAPPAFWPSNNRTKTGFNAQTIRPLAHDSDDPPLSCCANHDIYWDRIVSIEYVGEKQTYDLEVPGTHNFVANDFLVHNSHASDYAVITVQTAYLKAHYPVEYMCALLEVEFDDPNKVPIFITECRRLGIDVLQPDINSSGAKFTIEQNPKNKDLAKEDHRRWAIRVGLGAIKNVGLSAVELILEQREEEGAFKSMDEFCERLNLRALNRRVIESLGKVGCFDELVRPVVPNTPREVVTHKEVIDRMMGVSQQIHKAAAVGQLSMFGMMTATTPQLVRNSVLKPLPKVSEIDPRKRLDEEKELLGIYISEHPLQQVAAEVGNHITQFCGEVSDADIKNVVVIAGLLSELRVITTKKGQLMAFLKLEDLHGHIDVVVFPKLYEKTKDILEEDQILLVQGKVESRNDSLNVLADKIEPYQAQSLTLDQKGAVKQTNGSDPKAAQSAMTDTVQYQLTLSMNRTENHENDVRRFHKTITALKKHAGMSTVSLHCTLLDGTSVHLNFPKLTTSWNAALRDLLNDYDIEVKVKDVTPDPREKYRKKKEPQT
ncbi:MAG: DNA polymerase III subunit alpha [Ardenticatenaceae bacterium]